MRGSRYWTHAEVLAPTIFIVEGFSSSTNTTPANPARFITPDFFEVRDICQAWALNEVKLMIYTSYQVNQPTRFLFGEIVEAYGGRRLDPLFLKLAAGNSITLGNTNDSPSVAALTVGQRLFPL